jgi:hypothetical protein
MTLLDKMKEIAEAACPRLTWYYDIRQMQNVTADDGKFPAIFMEEYYASTLREGYGWRREVTVELHFLDLVPMHGEAEARERVREWLLANGVMPFLHTLNADQSGVFSTVTECQCDPEPPMFDANATGVLLRFTTSMPACLIEPEREPETEPEQTDETD